MVRKTLLVEKSVIEAAQVAAVAAKTSPKSPSVGSGNGALDSEGMVLR